MENERNAEPEWLNNMDSRESEFSGYSEDEIDSNRAYSLENDHSGQSGSESEQEDGPDERWVVNDGTARPKFPFFGPVPGTNVVLGTFFYSSSLPFFLK